MTNKIPIVFSTDNNYVMQTGVAILSLLESANPTTVYDIFVLINDDVTEESKQLLRKQVGCFENHSIDFISVGNVFENAFEIRNVSIATYSRLLIPWLLPQYDKVIYSDVDIIFHIDLSSLYKMDMEDKYFAGVPDTLCLCSNKFRNYIKKNGTTPERYINAGFLMINSALQRELNLKERWLEEAKKRYMYQDQDIINIVSNRKISLLPCNYNVQKNFYDIISTQDENLNDKLKDSDVLSAEQCMDEVINECICGRNCVIHYNGKKPWNAMTYEWRDWWETYQESIFYDPIFELQVTYNIFHAQSTWRSIAAQVKRKLIALFLSQK